MACYDTKYTHENNTIYIIQEAQCNSKWTILYNEISMSDKDNNSKRYNTDIEIECMHENISRYKIELFCFVLP